MIRGAWNIKKREYDEKYRGYKKYLVSDKK